MINGIEQNPKLGFYQVGEEIFYSKPQAFLRGSEKGLYPLWNFNTKEFARYNWNVEPETNLRELYRLRAQQLRDQYDWIRIEASGGGDSTTAIFSFLLNGIHLDEIVFRYPKQLEKDVTDNPFDTRPENTLSEWRYAAKPLMDWVSVNYPNTKVTFHDYSENLLNESYMKDESWVFTTRDWFQPGHGIKHHNFGIAEHRAIADSGKKICVVYGVDKPKLALIDNDWYVYFIDVHANHPNPIIGEYSNITSELFYWTPDMPELVAKQAHMVKNWFEMSQNQHLQHISVFPSNVISKNYRTTYENLVKSIVYPDYDQQTWQTAKPTNSFYNEMDHWFHTNMRDTDMFSAWNAGLDFLVNKIDPKFFMYELGRPVGIIIKYSPFYYLGSSNNNVSTFKFTNRDHMVPSVNIAICRDRKIKQILV
jgi:hypothetical protein